MEGMYIISDSHTYMYAIKIDTKIMLFLYRKRDILPTNCRGIVRRIVCSNGDTMFRVWICLPGVSNQLAIKKITRTGGGSMM